MITGWFAEFGLLPSAGARGVVAYADGPDRFAGATYDPTSHYRGAAVFDFFAAQGLTPDLLRAGQPAPGGPPLPPASTPWPWIPALIRRDRSVPLARPGRLPRPATPRAPRTWCAGLRARGVSADARGAVLRLGPAPYLPTPSSTRRSRPWKPWRNRWPEGQPNRALR